MNKCDALLRDGIFARREWQTSDNAKLIFYAMLTEKNYSETEDIMGHEGQVSFGPIKIGPGKWSKENQEKLKHELNKLVDIDQVISSASSLAVTSGDPVIAKAYTDCIERDGGMSGFLEARGPNSAIFTVMWTEYPGMTAVSTVKDFTVRHGLIVGGELAPGTILKDRAPYVVTLGRSKPDEGLSVVLNTDRGPVHGYLPPRLPDVGPPPGLVVRIGQVIPVFNNNTVTTYLFENYGPGRLEVYENNGTAPDTLGFRVDGAGGTLMAGERRRLTLNQGPTYVKVIQEGNITFTRYRFDQVE